MQQFLLGCLVCGIIIMLVMWFVVIRKQKKALMKEGYSDERFIENGEGLERLNQYRYQYDRERKKDLEHLLEHAKDLLEDNGHYDYPQNHPIFSFIRTLTMKVQTENDLNVLKQKGDRISYDIDSKRSETFNYTSAYFDFLEQHVRDHWIFNDVTIKTNKPLYIHLGKEPLISRVWRDDRLLRALKTIGSDVYRNNDYLGGIPLGYQIENNQFVQDNNHVGVYQYPFGFTYIDNGNHSVNAGIIKGEGILEINEIHDLSGMYERYKFDGTYLLDRMNINEQERIPFEFGVIFEIGRILLDYPDVFPNEVQKSIATK